MRSCHAFIICLVRSLRTICNYWILFYSVSGYINQRKIKCITRVSSNLLVYQLIVGKYGTSSICSPRMICEILSSFYHLFAEKSTSYLQLLDFCFFSIWLFKPA